MKSIITGHIIMQDLRTLNQYAKIYADQFRLAYNTLTSVYSNARVYISLDHLWNTNNVSGTFASRKMLDTVCLQDSVPAVIYRMESCLSSVQFSTDRTTFLGKHKQAAYKISFLPCYQYGKYSDSDELYPSEIRFQNAYHPFRTGLYICTERQKCRKTSGRRDRIFVPDF